jgi:hypothetical protein
MRVVFYRLLISVSTFRPLFIFTSINRKIFDTVGTITSLNGILQMQGRYGLTLPKIEYAKVKTGLTHSKSTFGNSLRNIAFGTDEVFTPQKEYGTAVSIPFVHLLQSIAKSVPTAPINSCKFSRDNQITLWTGALWGDAFVASIVRAFVINSYLVQRTLLIQKAHFDSEDNGGHRDMIRVKYYQVCFGEIETDAKELIKRMQHLIFKKYSNKNTTTMINGFYTQLNRLYRLRITLSNNLFVEVSREVILPSPAHNNYNEITDDEIYAITWNLCTISNHFILEYNRGLFLGIDALIHRCGSFTGTNVQNYGEARQRCSYSLFDSVNKKFLQDPFYDVYFFDRVYYSRNKSVPNSRYGDGKGRYYVHVQVTRDLK